MQARSADMPGGTNAASRVPGSVRLADRAEDIAPEESRDVGGLIAEGGVVDDGGIVEGSSAGSDCGAGAGCVDGYCGCPD